MVRFSPATLTLVAVVLSSSTQAYRPGDSVCTYATSRSSCSFSTITPSKTDKSVLIYPGGKARCAFDDYTDAKTTFKTNSTYFFQVFPKNQKKKLALILEGGGACIDKRTCNFALQCSLPQQLIDTTADASSTGILNTTDPNNAFKDWNIVYVPYLSWSPEEDLPQRLQQRQGRVPVGPTNYPDVEELVVGGMSAGSLGAQALASYAADLWDVERNGVKYGVIADSYIGVLPANTTAGKVLNFYGGCRGDLLLPPAALRKCKAETMTIPDLTTSQLQKLPWSTWLWINSMGDATQRLFYQLCKDGITAYPFTNRILAEVYFAEATKILNAYKATSRRVSTFIVAGTQHIFLNLPTYYTTASTTGQTFGSYLTNWLTTLTY